MNFESIARSFGVIVLLSALAACGGGGGSGADAPTATVSASSITPTSAIPGTTLTITGVSLTKVSAVTVGGIAASFKVVSDTEITVTVPAGLNTATTTVTLSGTGFSFQVSTAIALDIPTLSSVSASAVVVGDSITVTGAHLDSVDSFTVNGVQLIASNVTATSATLTTPTTPTSGALVLVDNAGTSYASPYQISSFAPLLVGSLSRATAVVGDTVIVFGAGLDSVSSVTFANGAVGTITGRTPTTLNFTVPAGALVAGAKLYTSALTLTSALQHATSSATLTVGASLTATTTTATSDGAILTVSVSGNNLSLVTSATVGGVAATVVSATDAMLTLNVPASASGAVLLSSPYQTGVTAGSVSATTTAVLALSELDFAQVYNKAGTDSTLRLTPGRPVLARAFLTTTKSGTSSIPVSLVVSNGSSYVGALTMTGPSTIPTAVNAYSLATTYNVTVPAAWVSPGVSFKVVLSGSTQTVSASPVVGGSAKLHVVLVPLSIGGVAGQLPLPSAAHDSFARTYPLGASDITVTTRAAFVPAGVSGIATVTDASNTLSQLETLRSQENPGAFYYGIFATSIDTSNLAGLGYVGVVGFESQSAESAVGYDSSSSFTDVDPFNVKTPEWAETMLHEVGHNHSLNHAPCGNPGGVDPNYPYAGGVIGNQGVYNSLYASDTSIGVLASPTLAGSKMTDVMGYCGGYFFSDYNYAKVQSYAEARTVSVPAPMVRLSAASSAATAPSGYLVISGSVGPKGVQLNPAHATSMAAGATPAQSKYAMRVTTAAGQTFTYPVLVHVIADSEPGASHFARTIPNPGKVTAVEILFNGVALTSAEAESTTRMHAAAARSTGESVPAAHWSESGGKLHVVWNSGVEPYAAVTHIADDGTRLVVALRLEGGDSFVDVAAMPVGGKFEISFSSLTSARQVTVPR